MEESAFHYYGEEARGLIISWMLVSSNENPEPVVLNDIEWGGNLSK
jgi:hypothetical protein